MNGQSFNLDWLSKTPAGKLESNQHLFKNGENTEVSGKKKNKYGNRKVETEDGVFDSVKEAKRGRALRLLLKSGKIAYLARQVDFELNAGGSHSLIYRADFVYTDISTGKTVIEDVKGMRTEVYKKKYRLMKEVHGIEISEL